MLGSLERGIEAIKIHPREHVRAICHLTAHDPRCINLDTGKIRRLQFNDLRSFRALDQRRQPLDIAGQHATAGVEYRKEYSPMNIIGKCVSNPKTAAQKVQPVQRHALFTQLAVDLSALLRTDLKPECTCDHK